MTCADPVSKAVFRGAPRQSARDTRSVQFSGSVVSVLARGVPIQSAVKQMSSIVGSSPTRKKRSSPPLLSQHSLSSPNVLEYLTSPPKVSTSTPDLKIKSTILPGRRTRSPSPTPPPYPGYSASGSGIRTNPTSGYPFLGSANVGNPNAVEQSFGNSKPPVGTSAVGPSDTGRYNPSLWSNSGGIMSSYLGDCVKYPTNRNYGSNINRQIPPGIPPSPRKAQRPTCLIQDPNFCLSCPPARLQFSAAMDVKQQDPEIPGEVDRDYIGFATLPEQIHRKSVKKGFDFTLMVVGESGLGKSTLVNSLFLNELYKDRKIPDVSERIEKTTSIEKKSMDIEERGVKLRLTVVDTPGYGDSINGEESWRACCSYIDDQMRQYFQDESGLNRKNIQDNRVHCCLYFIPPYGHGLRQLDLEFMKRLHRKVNIVPVIAKADTLTAPEVKRLKERVMADIEDHQVGIYQFPDCDSDEDEEFKQQDRELKASVPFAVVGSNIVIEVNGKQTRGRQYPWGVVEVENPKHSDFMKLRNMLICTHMHDLKDITQDVHYENFRAQCISQISKDSVRERTKLKRDSNGQIDSNITETDRLLLQKDEEIRRMQDMLKQMQEKLQTGHENKRDSIVNV